MMWLLEKFNTLNQIKDTLKTKSIVTWMVNVGVVVEGCQATSQSSSRSAQSFSWSNVLDRIQLWT